MDRNIKSQAHPIEYYEQLDSTIKNGEAKIPICFCIDTSSSMNIILPSDDVEEVPGTRRFEDGNKIYDVRSRSGRELPTRLTQLKNVFTMMLKKMKQNPIISKSSMICIINFDQFADCIREFTNVHMLPPNILDNVCTGSSYTNASKGLSMALDRIENQKIMSRNAENDIYKPVIIFMSDGNPTDVNESNRMRDQIRQLSEDKKINVIPIAIGSNLDERWLKSLTRDSRVHYMETEEDFQSVFDEITRRVQRVTNVIATDESEDQIVNIDNNVNSTEYGKKTEVDEMMDFFNQSFNY